MSRAMAEGVCIDTLRNPFRFILYVRFQTKKNDKTQVSMFTVWGLENLIQQCQEPKSAIIYTYSTQFKMQWIIFNIILHYTLRVKQLEEQHSTANLILINKENYTSRTFFFFCIIIFFRNCVICTVLVKVQPRYFTNRPSIVIKIVY